MKLSSPCELQPRRLLGCERAPPAPCQRPPARRRADDVRSAAASDERCCASQMAAAALAACLLVGGPAPAHADVPANSPYALQNTVEYGVDPSTGSIRPCPTNLNPNCVSTGSTNETYGPPWRANEASPKQAAAVLEDAVAELFDPDTYELLSRSTQQDGAEYRAFAFASTTGTARDVAEFYIKNQSVMDRGWEGDTEGWLVTYRSIAGSVRYIYPFSQPITDFGAQGQRLERIRQALGWPVIGCEVPGCDQISSSMGSSFFDLVGRKLAR